MTFANAASASWSSRKVMNGLLPTGASTFARSARTGRKRVPSPPARIAAVMSIIDPLSTSVAEEAQALHRIALEQLANTLIERALRPEAGLAKTLTRHDVIPPVGVVANGSEVDVKPGHMLFDLQGQS